MALSIVVALREAVVDFAAEPVSGYGTLAHVLSVGFTGATNGHDGGQKS